MQFLNSRFFTGGIHPIRIGLLLLFIGPSINLRSEEVLQSKDVRLILEPLIQSAATPNKTLHGKEVRLRVGDAARLSVGRLNKYATGLSQIDSKRVIELSKDISYPFQSCVDLRGNAAAKAALDRAIFKKNEWMENPPTGPDGTINYEGLEVLLANAQRNIDSATVKLKSFDKTRIIAAGKLEVTSRQIARHLEQDNILAAQALGVCMFVLKDTEGLVFPFKPSVSRIWVIMSSLDEETRRKVQESAKLNLVKWASINIGAETVTYHAWKEMLRGVRGSSIAELIGPAVAGWLGEQIQYTAQQEIERNLEIIFYQPKPVASDLRQAVEKILMGSTPGETFTEAAIEVALNEVDPDLGSNAIVVNSLLELLNAAVKADQGE